jgi:hypothetical protein
MNRLLPRTLWGVTLCGVVNCLLWEQGFRVAGGRPLVVLVCIAAVSALSGAVTPETPSYICVALAIGSGLPLSDLPPVPSGSGPSL